ncbi:hypothetical protein BDY24DRAFT_280039 [Mrakia frigida]|uniref:uncharacterized protein n=1 Tax=Mrakia frigida TaxID=29902 RepID=UPI003FCC0A9F
MLQPMRPSYLALALLLLPVTSFAHLALWDPGMYGFDGNITGVVNFNNNVPVLPLKAINNLTVSQWFGNGQMGFPPAEGVFMELPAGSTYHGEIACNRGLTSHRDPRIAGEAMLEHPCQTVGPMHTVLNFGEAVNASLLGGCALSIAYESDVTKLKPSDFTVISTNSTCGWWRETDFEIPADLPACPEGGCHCGWNWIHTAGNYNAEGRGEGYGAEMNDLKYRCKITGSSKTTAEVSIAAGQIANECAGDSSKCTAGAKQPHYWSQLDGNNNFASDLNPPLHNMNYGFSNGAQTDIFIYSTVIDPTTTIAVEPTTAAAEATTTADSIPTTTTPPLLLNSIQSSSSSSSALSSSKPSTSIRPSSPSSTLTSSSPTSSNSSNTSLTSISALRKTTNAQCRRRKSTTSSTLATRSMHRRRKRSHEGSSWGSWGW